MILFLQKNHSLCFKFAVKRYEKFFIENFHPKGFIKQ